MLRYSISDPTFHSYVNVTMVQYPDITKRIQSHFGRIDEIIDSLEPGTYQIQDVHHAEIQGELRFFRMTIHVVKRVQEKVYGWKFWKPKSLPPLHDVCLLKFDLIDEESFVNDGILATQQKHKSTIVQKIGK